MSSKPLSEPESAMADEGSTQSASTAGHVESPETPAAKSENVQTPADRENITVEDLASARELDSRSVYVSNVDYAATPQHLEEIFSQVGHVSKVTILVQRYTGFPKGYAYVAFKEKESVKKAISQLGETLLNGRPLKVHEKKTISHDHHSSARENGGSRGSTRGGRGGRGRGRGRGMGRGRGRGRGRGGLGG